MCFILSNLKCYENVTSSLEIIFEMQKKMNNEEITRRNISFSTYKINSFFFSLDPSYFQTS